ncbi:SdiA-regulated domain-containing protein [Melittangium boletus]|uniref:SdiA-regulated domain-containing protein n=1 Tax=Melittangium boletus TaxID=83453 RepID=UPI003DA2F76D
MSAPSAVPPAPLEVRDARPERVALPFGPEQRVSQLLPALSKVVKEPSGIVFHPGRGTLFVVGDKGDVAELTREGEVRQRTRHDGLGFEGITVGPDGRLFAIEEKKKPRIHELDPETLKLKAEYEVYTKLKGERVVGTTGNKSAEGLCYVPEQDAFYVVNQSPPWLVKLRVPLDKKEGKAKALEAVDLSSAVRQQASDVHYDAATGHFLITESGAGLEKGAVHEVTREGQRVGRFFLPGVRAEGLALDGAGRAYIADDAGGVLRIER